MATQIPGTSERRVEQGKRSLRHIVVHTSLNIFVLVYILNMLQG